jgi:hypothetical protein
LHPAGRQPDAKFISLVTGCMQTIDKFGHLLDAICNRLAAN